MPSQTTALAIPYPLGTDLLADGDNAIQSVAQRVDDLGVSQGAAAYPTQTPAVWSPAAGIGGQGSYLRRNGVCHCELAFQAPAGGVASAAPLSVALPTGFRPLVQVIRQCQGAGVLRGVYMGTDGILRCDFGGAANAGFFGGFSYPCA